MRKKETGGQTLGVEGGREAGTEGREGEGAAQHHTAESGRKKRCSREKREERERKKEKRKRERESE